MSSAELFGISTPGKLGSRNEIIDHSEYFRKMVIQPFQDEMLPVFNKMLSLFSGKQTILIIEPLSIYQTIPITEESDEASTPINTDNKPAPPVKEQVNRPKADYPNLNQQ